MPDSRCDWRVAAAGRSRSSLRGLLTRLDQRCCERYGSVSATTDAGGSGSEFDPPRPLRRAGPRCCRRQRTRRRGFRRRLERADGHAQAFAQQRPVVMAAIHQEPRFGEARKRKIRIPKRTSRLDVVGGAAAHPSTQPRSAVVRIVATAISLPLRAARRSSGSRGAPHRGHGAEDSAHSTRYRTTPGLRVSSERGRFQQDRNQSAHSKGRSGGGCASLRRASGSPAKSCDGCCPGWGSAGFRRYG